MHFRLENFKSHRVSVYQIRRKYKIRYFVKMLHWKLFFGFKIKISALLHRPYTRPFI